MVDVQAGPELFPLENQDRGPMRIDINGRRLTWNPHRQLAIATGILFAGPVPAPARLVNYGIP
jgi:hypothetical protein